jgi:hypothetical protein
MPSKELIPGITKPSAIKGASESFEVSAWPEQGQRGAYISSEDESLDGLVEAVVEAAY